MSRERSLARRMRTLTALGEVLNALRSLSAQHFRAARAALSPARLYREELARFLGLLAPLPRVDRPKTGIVLVTADLGLVGDYTATLVREALALRAAEGEGPLVCVGRRAVSHLARAGVQPVSVHASPASAAGLADLLIPLVDGLLGLRDRGELDALWLVAARFEGAGRYAPARVRVLPWPAPTADGCLPPSPYVDLAMLRTIVSREYLYASLYETLLESLASEHGKRLVMTESAREWLEQRLEATRRQVASMRRESSTQEVLEVAAAARLLERRS